MFILLPRLAAGLALATLPPLTFAAPLTLGQALELAVERSESGRAATAGVLGANEMARAAGQLPDPVLRAGIDNLPVTGPDRLHTARDSMTMKRIGISQEWVSSDKREARRAAALALVDRQVTAARTAVAEVRLQTALAFVDACFADEALALTALAERQAHEEAETGKGRLASSAGGSAEVLALTAASGLAEDESAEVRQQRGAARVALERWTGVPADALEHVAVDDAAVGAPAFVANHPTVLAATADVDVARQEAAAVATRRRPNWTWEVSYGQRTGYSDMVSFGVNIPLPVAPDSRQDRETAAQLALVEKAEAALAEATRAATAEFETLRGDARRLADRIGRYQSAVVAPARQRTAAALAGYGSNQGNLTALFEARRAEIEAQRRLLSLRRDLARAQARLAFTPLGSGSRR